LSGVDANRPLRDESEALPLGGAVIFAALNSKLASESITALRGFPHSPENSLEGISQNLEMQDFIQEIVFDQGVKQFWDQEEKGLLISSIFERNPHLFGGDLEIILKDMDFPPRLNVAHSNFVSYLIANQMLDNSNGLPQALIDSKFSMRALNDIGNTEMANILSRKYGDLYIQQSTKILQETLDELYKDAGYFIARVGGDEFVICQYDQTADPFDNELFNKRLNEKLALTRFPKGKIALDGTVELVDSQIELHDNSHGLNKEGKRAMEAHLEQLYQRAHDFITLTSDPNRLREYLGVSNEDMPGTNEVFEATKLKLVQNYTPEMRAWLETVPPDHKKATLDFLAITMYSSRDVALITRAATFGGPEKLEALKTQRVITLTDEGEGYLPTFATCNPQKTEIHSMTMTHLLKRIPKLVEQYGAERIVLFKAGNPGMLKPVNEVRGHVAGDQAYDEMVTNQILGFHRGLLGEYAEVSPNSGELIGVRILTDAELQSELCKKQNWERNRCLIFGTEFAELTEAGAANPLYLPEPKLLQIYEAAFNPAISLKEQITALFGHADMKMGKLAKDLVRRKGTSNYIGLGGYSVRTLEAALENLGWGALNLDQVSTVTQTVANWAATYFTPEFTTPTGIKINNRTDTRLQRLGFQFIYDYKRIILNSAQKYFIKLQTHGAQVDAPQERFADASNFLTVIALAFGEIDTVAKPV
jgi:GGDEF domain-containing protein